jgi:hypothetical protein
MSAAGLSRRQHALVLWLARLAVLVYVFQVGAIDHWHVDPDRVSGLVGSQLHAAHCHSDTANCADSSGLTGTLAELRLTPLLPPATAQLVVDAPASPVEAMVLTPHQPPRAA